MSMPTRSARGEHEFTPEQTELISNLSSSLRWIGFGVIAAGFVLLLHFCKTGYVLSTLGGGSEASVYRMLLSGALAALLLPMGYWLELSGRLLRQVAREHGSDLGHLMDAFRTLARFFGYTFWLLVIGGVALIVILALDVGQVI